jgi:hypothetical protein
MSKKLQEQALAIPDQLYRPGILLRLPGSYFFSLRDPADYVSSHDPGEERIQSAFLDSSLEDMIMHAMSEKEKGFLSAHVAFLPGRHLLRQRRTAQRQFAKI